MSSSSRGVFRAFGRKRFSKDRGCGGDIRDARERMEETEVKGRGRRMRLFGGRWRRERGVGEGLKEMKSVGSEIEIESCSDESESKVGNGEEDNEIGLRKGFEGGERRSLRREGDDEREDEWLDFIETASCERGWEPYQPIEHYYEVDDVLSDISDD